MPELQVLKRRTNWLSQHDPYGANMWRPIKWIFSTAVALSIPLAIHMEPGSGIGEIVFAVFLIASVATLVLGLPSALVLVVIHGLRGRRILRPATPEIEVADPATEARVNAIFERRKS